MLIVSKFHDYYDTITSFGIDKTVVYERRPRTRLLTKVESAELATDCHTRTKLGERSGALRVIGFCGKLYPLIDVERTRYGFGVDSNEFERVLCYTEDGALNTMARLGFNLEKRSWLGRRRLGAVEGIRSAMKPETYPHLQKLFIEEKCPIFVAGDDLEVDEESEKALPYVKPRALITFNPRLSDYHFQSVIDPVTAFQQIYMFISGVLGTPERPIVEIDDKHKAIAKGHDGKYSFRKPPGGGRWR